MDHTFPLIAQRLLLWVAVFLFLTSSSFSQQLIQRFHPFGIFHQTDRLDNPFAGGLEAPIIQFVDIDGDGDFDLFILDRDGQLNFYRNAGNASQPHFVIEELNFQNVEAGLWFRFVDIDADGDYDLFCNGEVSTVQFYRNIGTATMPKLLLETTAVTESGGSLMLSENISIPAFADMDGDGDMDFFSGNSVGSIWYYENIGSRTQFEFRFVTDRYQDLQIIGAGGSVVPPDPTILGTQKNLHGAMAIDFGDLDGDGDLDLVWGDFFNPSLYYIENRGTASNPQLVLADSTFPKPSSVQTPGFNMPQLVDIDGDGDLDLFIGVLFARSTDNLLFYRNTGTASQPHFQLEAPNFLSMIDVGAASSPVFVDVDGDGDLDLLIGMETGGLVLYERRGASSQPEVHHITNQFINLTGLFNISPTVGDLDGDGVPELVIGDLNGRLRVYKKSGATYDSAGLLLGDISAGLNASPTLADLDDDGDLDLLVGTGGGRLRYYRNDGTAANPNFTLISDFYASIDVGDDAKPVVIDLDGDGLWDLVIGAREGGLHFWRNVGTKQAPSFQHVPGFFAGTERILRTAPAFADVNGDGYADLFLGNVKGGLFFFEGRRDDGGLCFNEETIHLHQNFPNPAQGVTTIVFCLPTDRDMSLVLYDVLGRKLRVLYAGRVLTGSHEISVHGSSLPSGVYFYRLETEGVMKVQRMVVIN